MSLAYTPELAVGRLATRDRRIFFEFDQDFLATGIPLSPFKLPLKPGVQQAKENLYGGLFGVFNDSLPDGWGRLLLDRHLRRQGMEPDALTPLDRLALVGTQGMGALRYHPDRSSTDIDPNPLVLDQLAVQAEQELSGTPSKLLEELLKLAGSSAGARPKILVDVSSDRSIVLPSQPNATPGFTSWLLKFRTSTDEPDMGAIEYAYSLMARDAGLDVPETFLFPSAHGPGYFGVRRFDRRASGPIHMHSAAGLLHADHRLPSLDYDNLLKATKILTKDMREVEKLFQLAVFNVLSHNRDDHTKNVSFLMDEKGTWRVAPAYDLTYSAGPGGEHSLMIAGEGRNPGASHLKRLGTTIGLEPRRIQEILDTTKVAIFRWQEFASIAGVSAKTSNRIHQEFQRLLLLP